MSDELVTHLLDLLSGTAWARRIVGKRMFGGHGLFDGPRMVALIADDTLYLKADDASRKRFTDLGLPPFTYARAGGKASLSYFQAPPESLEDGDELAAWLDIAAGAARRTAAKKAKPKSRRKKKPRKAAR